ncbi:MAG: lipid-A-disaccharide synthase-related protein [Cyanobacteria bacterium J06649_4]
MTLLCISNGHGEDVIALRILEPLRQHRPEIALSALPISGVGTPYRSADIPIIGPTKALPSGGFLNREAKQLAQDVRGGLISLTRSQLSAIKSWKKAQSPNHSTTILAVGDIVPLLFAYLSGLPYHFVGTAKSEYWLRDERGKLPPETPLHRLEGWSGSVYLPWERWLMGHSRCRSVFVRDALTARYLKKFGIHATYAGNPMMDSLAPTGKLKEQLNCLRSESPQVASPPVATSLKHAKATALFLTPKPPPKPLTIALIPGSRAPEAYENWRKILATLPGLIAAFPERSLILLAAIAPSLDTKTIRNEVISAGAAADSKESSIYESNIYRWEKAALLLSTDAFSDCLHEAEVAIATAGTATEQFVGLGKPAITLPGDGPQFTKAFATVQAKMLGPSVQMVNEPHEVGGAIAQLITNPDRLQLIYQNGKHRMGEPGAGERIAQKILAKVSDDVEAMKAG